MEQSKHAIRRMPIRWFACKCGTVFDSEFKAEEHIVLYLTLNDSEPSDDDQAADDADLRVKMVKEDR